MKKYFIIVSLLFFLINCNAQNWQGFQLQDTSYFFGETSSYNSGYGSLKTLWIDSVQLAGSDSLFYFTKELEFDDNNYYNQCIKLNGASWMGSYFVKQANTNELYFNFRNDTLLIKNNANINDTWLLMTDSVGLHYYITVTNIGTKIIDNSLDSIKEFTIQVYNGSTLINNFYTNYKFILSKNHGFINIVSFLNFPYKNEWIDLRVDSTIEKLNFAFVNLQKKYQPGNEWIIYNYTGGDYFQNADSTTYTHDSIISSTLIAPNKIAVNYYRGINILKLHKNNIGQLDYKLDTFYSQIRIDTFSQSMNTIMLQPCDYGKTPYCIVPYPSKQLNKFFSQYFTIYPSLQESLDDSPFFHYDSICSKLIISISGSTVGYHTTISELGFYVHEKTVYGGSAEIYEKLQTNVIYFKIDSNIYQNKINIRTLPIKNVVLGKSNFNIYPNPCNDNLFIDNNGNTIKSVEIVDLLGNVLIQLTNNFKTINVQNLASGIYILKIKSTKGIEVFKFIKQ